MFGPNPEFFSLLPIEILGRVYSYLSLQDFSSISLLKKEANKAVKANYFWKDKLRIHFPRKFQKNQEKQGINWSNLFWKTYKIQYAGLTPEQKQLFSLVKDEDFTHL